MDEGGVEVSVESPSRTWSPAGESEGEGAVEVSVEFPTPRTGTVAGGIPTSISFAIEATGSAATGEGKADAMGFESKEDEGEGEGKGAALLMLPDIPPMPLEESWESGRRVLWADLAEDDSEPQPNKRSRKQRQRNRRTRKVLSGIGSAKVSPHLGGFHVLRSDSERDDLEGPGTNDGVKLVEGMHDLGPSTRGMGAELEGGGDQPLAQGFPDGKVIGAVVAPSHAVVNGVADMTAEGKHNLGPDTLGTGVKLEGGDGQPLAQGFPDGKANGAAVAPSHAVVNGVADMTVVGMRNLGPSTLGTDAKLEGGGGQPPAQAFPSVKVNGAVVAPSHAVGNGVTDEIVEDMHTPGSDSRDKGVELEGGGNQPLVQGVQNMAFGEFSGAVDDYNRAGKTAQDVHDLGPGPCAQGGKLEGGGDQPLVQGVETQTSGADIVDEGASLSLAARFDKLHARIVAEEPDAERKALCLAELLRMRSRVRHYGWEVD